MAKRTLMMPRTRTMPDNAKEEDDAIDAKEEDDANDACKGGGRH